MVASTAWQLGRRLTPTTSRSLGRASLLTPRCAVATRTPAQASPRIQRSTPSGASLLIRSIPTGTHGQSSLTMPATGSRLTLLVYLDYVDNAGTSITWTTTTRHTGWFLAPLARLLRGRRLERVRGGDVHLLRGAAISTAFATGGYGANTNNRHARSPPAIGTTDYTAAAYASATLAASALPIAVAAESIAAAALATSALAVATTSHTIAAGSVAAAAVAAASIAVATESIATTTLATSALTITTSRAPHKSSRTSAPTAPTRVNASTVATTTLAGAAESIATATVAAASFAVATEPIAAAALAYASHAVAAATLAVAAATLAAAALATSALTVASAPLAFAAGATSATGGAVFACRATPAAAAGVSSAVATAGSNVRVPRLSHFNGRHLPELLAGEPPPIELRTHPPAKWLISCLPRALSVRTQDVDGPPRPREYGTRGKAGTWYISAGSASPNSYAKSVAGVGSDCANGVTAWEAYDSNEDDKYTDINVSWACKPAYADVCRCDTYEGTGFTSTVLNTKWSLTADPGDANGDSRPVFVNEDASRCTMHPPSHSPAH
eukprot:scaffold83812_cov53-Phaeocystis_antarctica.AAC.4